MAMQLLLLIAFAGVANSQHSCLTWELNGNNLSLICRIQTQNQTVSFIDSNGKLQAKCSFNNTSKCESFHINGSITANVHQYKVVFIIKQHKDTRFINEAWTCSQGNDILTTVVSTSRGIVADTNLILSGIVSSSLYIVTLRCFSCREPHGNNAEFFKDDKSEDSIRYNSVTKTCTHVMGECRPETCACTPSGNEFMRNFSVVDFYKDTKFACAMKFVDNETSSRFLKVSSVILNEKEFIYNGSQTILTIQTDSGQSVNYGKRNMSDDRNNVNRTVSSTNTAKPGEVIKWIVIGVAVAMPFVLLGIVIICCRPFTYTKRNNDEGLTLLRQTELLAPKNFDIVQCTDCSITCIWDITDGDGSLKYELFHKSQELDEWKSLIIPIGKVSINEDGCLVYNIKDLLPNTCYELKMCSIDKKGKRHFTESRMKRTRKLSIFTSKLMEYYCIEGEMLELKCSVYADSICVEWFKNISKRYGMDRIETNNNILIDNEGKDHVLTIKNAKVTDSGKYTIIAGHDRQQLTVTVAAFFKRPLENKTIMEGINVQFECEAEKPYPVVWFKNNMQVMESSRFQIKTHENFHILTIHSTTLEDKGTYRIQMNDMSCDADLDVKEMPDAIKQMSDHDRNMFLKACRTGTTVRYNIRISIVGQSGVGKTCLLRRLMNEPIDDVESSTDELNIEVKQCRINLQTQQWIFPSDEEFSKTAYQNEEFADCSFWDFAGQKEFYATHQMFLSTNAIHLVVTDISKDFGSKTHQDMIEDDFDNVGDYIDFWLENIHCHQGNTFSNKDDLMNPPVIMIGTGIDKIKNKEEQNEQIKGLHLLLGCHKRSGHIRQSYFLSNTKAEENKTDFDNLRKSIFEHAVNIPNWGDTIPTRWIVLEKEIGRQIAERKYVLPYEEAKHLAEMCSFPIGETEYELNSFLKYEHEIGNLIFFDDIKRYIILEPAWLVNVFKRFLSPFQFKSHLVDMPERSKLDSTGILPNKFIKKLLKKVPGLDSAMHTQFALQIMEKFDIIVNPTTLEANSEYYIPCMFGASGFEIIKHSFKIQDRNCLRTSWFCLDFEFLPPSFFNHVLVAFVRKYQLCTDKDDRPQLYRGIGIFNLEKSGCQKLIVCLTENAIAVQVWTYQYEDQQICNTNYSNIREYLINTVHLLQQRYKINVHYKCFLKCPEGAYHRTAGKVSCDENCYYFFCPEHGSVHTLKELRNIWFEEENEVNTGQQNNKPVKCHYCKKMPVYRCYECSNVLCNACYLIHDLKTNTECHTFQSTNDTMLLNKKFKVCDVSQVVDMRTLPGGLLVLALFDHRMLVTYSVSYKQQHQISVSGRPCSIAILDRNTVVVLLQRDFGIIESMEIVDVRQRQVIYHENMTFNLTCGLFCPVLFIDDQLYISSLSGIIVTNMSGTVDRKIQLGFIPRDMCYDTEAARIYCIEVSKKKLSCIDRDGNLLFAFTDSSLTNLKHLTLDNEGYVLILCCQGYDDDKVRNFKVHRMKPDGKSSEAIITWKQNITHRNSLSSITFQEESNQVVIRKENTVYIYGKQ